MRETLASVLQFEAAPQVMAGLEALRRIVLLIVDVAQLNLPFGDGPLQLHLLLALPQDVVDDENGCDGDECHREEEPEEEGAAAIVCLFLSAPT